MTILSLTLLVIIAKMAACTDDADDLNEKYLTMSESDFIEYFNSQNYSWKMQEYDQLFPLCDIGIPENIDEYPVQEYDEDTLMDLPENFDAREKWAQCETIKEINDQGNCGSCWTFGSANVASDRTCIHKNIHVELAEQDFECQKTNVCGGGVPFRAFRFWKDRGLVTRKCKPYDIEKLLENECNEKCVDNNITYTDDKHFADKVYKVHNTIKSIKRELFENGPIEASFVVYKDFQKYKSGIYEYKTGPKMGGHSVRVIGYGVENGQDYWLVANSWGPKWGENGLFRIKPFQKELYFERLLMAGFPKN